MKYSKQSMLRDQLKIKQLTLIYAKHKYAYINQNLSPPFCQSSIKGLKLKQKHINKGLRSIRYQRKRYDKVAS